MTGLSGGDDAAGRRGQFASAGGDAFVAGRDLIINEAGVPPFTVNAFVDPPAAGLGELTASRRQPSMLLTARRQAIDFTGRSAELTALGQWQDDPGVCRAWAWHGPGGQGKTRLAQQLGRQSAAAGWRVAVAGHRDAAPPDVAVKPLGTPRRWLPAGRRPLLLLVDYAERWPVHDLLRLLADCRSRAPKVRVLLLARSVDWWPTVAAELPRLGYVDGAEPRPLLALASDGPGRRVLFEAACRRFSEVYQPDMPGSGWPGRWQPPADLGDDRVYGTALGLHMTALATVDAYTRQTAPPATAGDVTGYLLDRERAYWARLHGSAPDTVTAAARTVLLACLAGPQTRDDGIRLLALTKLADGAVGQKLLDAHDRCYPPPGAGTVLEPMYPDRLAEDFIALSLPAAPTGQLVTVSGHTDSWTATTLLTAHRTTDDTVAYLPGPLIARGRGQKPVGHVARILIFLAAAAGRHPHIQGWLQTLLTTDPALPVQAGGIALTAVAGYTSPALAETIYGLLPHHSLDLGPAAATLAQHLLDHTDNIDQQRARHSSNLAIRLANIGQRQQALAPAEEATGIYRQLAEAHPDAHLPNLAASLNNLGNRLSELGRREQALAPAEEATGIYRRLAEAHPNAYLPDLATSLNNLGAFLSGLGRREQALAPAEEAVTIRRRLAEAHPDAYLPDLATSLNNLGTLLSELGRRDQALAPAEEATGIYRQLAEAHPDAYLPHLAASLTNLGTFQSGLGRRDQALAPAEEATGIYRQLAEAHPDAHLPNLAASLNNLGNRLSGLGRREQALVTAEEAVTIQRRLAEAHPDAYLPHFATSLNNLGTLLSELGRRDQALAPAEEAVTIQRRLAEAHPDAYLPHLAMSLNNFGNRLSEMGRREQALATAEEATGIYRQLAKAHPDAYLPNLAMSLNNFGSRLSEMGRREQALATAEEAVTIRRRLAEAHPDAHLPHLAMSLWAYGWVCVNVPANYAEALKSITEAISLYEPLGRRLPEMFSGQLFSACRTLADVLDGLGRTEEATNLRQQLDEAAGTRPGAEGGLSFRG
uniref:tetratricopeptide repeat protein n=1 Tax=Paractinoplanes polyasparticus TaxID=2856853 RepID=UPI001C860123|nr:tetratricopeptide repeat protein [Actinoplanes polyasparticus]